MKNFKSIFSVLVMSLMMFSCNESNQREEVTNEIKRVETIILPGTNAKGEISGTVEFTFNENSEAVTDIVMSPNLSDYLNLSDEELEVMVNNEVQATTAGAGEHDHASCIQGCNTTYTNADGTKKPGRGACKFNCWVSTTVQVLKAVATITAST